MRSTLLAILLALIVVCAGCGQKTEQTEDPEEAETPQETKRLSPGLGGLSGISTAEPGQRWLLKNRVPLMKEPREYDNSEDFEENMIKALPNGTEVNILETKEGTWLKAVVQDDSAAGERLEGWFSASNVLRAEKLDK